MSIPVSVHAGGLRGGAEFGRVEATAESAPQRVLQTRVGVVGGGPGPQGLSDFPLPSGPSERPLLSISTDTVLTSSPHLALRSL